MPIKRHLLSGIPPQPAPIRWLHSGFGQIGERIGRGVFDALREESGGPEAYRLREEYAEWMGWLLVYYIVIVYFVPVAWSLLDWVHIGLAWYPAYTFDRHGLSLVYAGSVLLAYGALVDNFLTERDDRAHLVAFTHLGFVLLSTGVVFQTSSMLHLNNVPPELQLLVRSDPLFTEPMARVVVEVINISAPFIAPPLTYFITRFQARYIPREHEQSTLDPVRWERKAELPKETECVVATNNPSAHVRILTTSGPSSLEVFAVQLECHTQSGWKLVARFNHDQRNEIAEDITKNGLRMKLYRNDRTEGGVQAFPDIDLVDAPSYCEIYLQRYIDELLQWFEQGENKVVERADNDTTGRLILWRGGDDRKTIRGDSTDLRYRQMQITAWGTEDVSSDTLLRLGLYPMNPPPRPNRDSQ